MLQLCRKKKDEVSERQKKPTTPTCCFTVFLEKTITQVQSNAFTSIKAFGMSCANTEIDTHTLTHTHTQLCTMQLKRNSPLAFCFALVHFCKISRLRLSAIIQAPPTHGASPATEFAFGVERGRRNPPDGGVRILSPPHQSPVT